MMKSEFEAIAKTPISEADFYRLEMVYTFHPSISETEGKQQIAYLYDTFGMRLIADMVPTAVKAMELEKAIAKRRSEIERLSSEIDSLQEDFEALSYKYKPFTASEFADFDMEGGKSNEQK